MKNGCGFQFDFSFELFKSAIFLGQQALFMSTNNNTKNNSDI